MTLTDKLYKILIQCVLLKQGAHFLSKAPMRDHCGRVS